jgi:hypothetical protein
MSRRTPQMDALVATALHDAAQDRQPVSGFTHSFYRYPARFSPTFAATAIRCLSRPGDLVLDPYMGGGTAVVEALALGRHAVGNDLNSLAAFVARVKTTPLESREVRAVRRWADVMAPSLSYRAPSRSLRRFISTEKTHNLSLARARFIKKIMAGALRSLESLPTDNARAFIRCALLRVGQWALDGRATQTPVEEFRQRLRLTTQEMLSALEQWAETAGAHQGLRCVIANVDAADTQSLPIFDQERRLADLVVTSPPYPRVHVLYHRWQVDGRRETPAPYWIAACNDGQGAAYYNFGDRREKDAATYFSASLRTLRAIRGVMKDGAIMVQLVAFSDPASQLDRYLQNMATAGFVELRPGRNRIWRQVPNRRWHAALRGDTASSREVVLVHQAV